MESVVHGRLNIYTQILVSTPPLCLLPMSLFMLLDLVLQVFPALCDRSLTLGCVRRPRVHLINVPSQLDYHIC